MILKTLPELKAQKQKLEKEIHNYDIKKIWAEILRKMSIIDYTMDLDEERLKIKINRGFNLYSWHLPKGVYYIYQSGSQLIIQINLDDDTVEKMRNADL
jgi:hypothetical protein